MENHTGAQRRKKVKEHCKRKFKGKNNTIQNEKHSNNKISLENISEKITTENIIKIDDARQLITQCVIIKRRLILL